MLRNRLVRSFQRIPPLTYTMIWLLLILFAPCESNEVDILWNPRVLYESYNRNTNILQDIYESGLLKGKESDLSFNIQEDIVSQSKINLKFDSNTTGVLVFEIIFNSVLDVKTLNNDTALLILKEAIFEEYILPNYCFWQSNNYKKRDPWRDPYGKVMEWGFDHQHVLSTQRIITPMVLNNTSLDLLDDNDNSTCRGDSGGRISGWGVTMTTKARKCHWPAFWLVVCPWYGIQHCQSK